MAGETDLNTLLATMEPQLLDEEYVFVSFPEGQYGDGAHLSPIAMFQEQEGMTLVISKTSALANNQPVENCFRCISLKVHSSLEAVGLTAAISTTLAEQGISANVIAAYYHDHVFVPAEEAQDALTLLQKIN